MNEKIPTMSFHQENHSALPHTKPRMSIQTTLVFHPSCIFQLHNAPQPPLNLRGGWGASHRLSSLGYLASSIDTEKLIKYYFPMRTSKITDIDEMLKMLPETARKEVRDFTAYLLDRERRRKALVDRVLKAEQNPDFVECKNPEEFIQAILNAPDDDEG